MKNEEFLELIGKIDSKYIEDSVNIQPNAFNSHSLRRIIMPALAASLILIGGILAVLKLHSFQHSRPDVNEILQSSQSLYNSISIVSEKKPTSSKSTTDQDEIYTAYADHSYSLNNTLHCIYVDPDYQTNVSTKYNWTLDFSLDNNTFIGNYSQISLNDTKDAYNATNISVEGTLRHSFSRINDYSFQANVDQANLHFYNCEFDADSIADSDLPIRFIYTNHMRAFEHPDTLVVFLPNTPKDSLPDCKNSDWICNYMESESKYTLCFLLYNMEDNVMYLVDTENPTRRT
ncbi:MAG: hypothetical protein VZR13_02005 [Saccharofermentanaceae bacterium]|nr:hypothetical protein [Saccharofermentanaceae bacterium]